MMEDETDEELVKKLIHCGRDMCALGASSSIVMELIKRGKGELYNEVIQSALDNLLRKNEENRYPRHCDCAAHALDLLETDVISKESKLKIVAVVTRYPGTESTGGRYRGEKKTVYNALKLISQEISDEELKDAIKVALDAHDTRNAKIHDLREELIQRTIQESEEKLNKTIEEIRAGKKDGNIGAVLYPTDQTIERIEEIIERAKNPVAKDGELLKGKIKGKKPVKRTKPAVKTRR